MKKLNLGSGDYEMPGYDNRDIKKGQTIFPLPDPDNSVDEIRASHCLEHFPYSDTEKILKEWVRALKPGGSLKISVPDFDWLAKFHLNSPDPRIEYALFGGQVDENDFHKALFTETKLRSLMERVGLTDIKRWESDFGDCSAEPSSLNLMGTKPRGADQVFEFVKDSRGVIHVGANDGYERDIYASYKLPVLWIEAIPQVYSKLLCNISRYPEQRALNYVVGDKDGAEVTFHISSNDGESSSIFPLKEHKKLWPNVSYIGNFTTASYTLPYIMARERIPFSQYDTLILDVQGAELQVLQGLGDEIQNFRFILCEASTVELYEGGATLTDLDSHMKSRGFRKIKSFVYGNARLVMDVLYERVEKEKMPSTYIHDPVSGKKGLLRVAGLASVPRLGFQAHSMCVEASFLQLKIPFMRAFGAYWCQSMQNGMEDLIEMGADYIITVDYDSIFTMSDVEELLRLAIRYPEADAIAAWQAARERKNSVLAGKLTPDGKAMGGAVSIDEIKATDLTPVDNTVFGLTLIKVAALKKVPKPWFISYPNEKGEWRAGKRDADSNFFTIFRQAGNRIFMANRVWIGQLQEDVIWVTPDFEFITQSLATYQREGRPFQV